MLNKKFIIIYSLFLYLAPYQFLAEENAFQRSQQSMDMQNKKLDQDTNDKLNRTKQTGLVNTKDELLEAINISPLLTKNEQHGRLYLSAFDPEHQLYPVNLLAIDGWQMPDEAYGKPILLAEGEHLLKLHPDFSNIHIQKMFMASDWPAKQITFKLNKEEHLAIAARLINKLTLQWNVEIYRIDAPIDAVSTDDQFIDQE
ncbi:MAG: hypothetical protein GY781_07100 [Gammaproteobacteria bacterium]|nr:hypothetical protein [Gammaproteobacteria bacterium]